MAALGLTVSVGCESRLAGGAQGRAQGRGLFERQRGFLQQSRGCMGRA